MIDTIINKLNEISKTNNESYIDIVIDEDISILNLNDRITKINIFRLLYSLDSTLEKIVRLTARYKLNLHTIDKLCSNFIISDTNKFTSMIICKFIEANTINKSYIDLLSLNMFKLSINLVDVIKEHVDKNNMKKPCVSLYNTRNKQLSLYYSIMRDNIYNDYLKRMAF